MPSAMSVGNRRSVDCSAMMFLPHGLCLALPFELLENRSPGAVRLARTIVAALTGHEVVLARTCLSEPFRESTHSRLVGHGVQECGVVLGELVLQGDLASH